MKRKTNWLITVLAVLAALLVCSHLRLTRNVQQTRLNDSAARLRSEERMNVTMPDVSVDISNGSAEELQTLYGVGPSLAQAIVEERENNGAFHYPEDLINVKGIGEKTLEQMLEQLRLPE